MRIYRIILLLALLFVSFDNAHASEYFNIENCLSDLESVSCTLFENFAGNIKIKLDGQTIFNENASILLVHLGMSSGLEEPFYRAFIQDGGVPPAPPIYSLFNDYDINYFDNSIISIFFNDQKVLEYKQYATSCGYDCVKLKLLCVNNSCGDGNGDGNGGVTSFFYNAEDTISSLPSGLVDVVSTTIGGIWPLVLLFMATIFAFWILVEIQDFLIKPEKQETKKQYKRGHRTADKYTAKIN